MSEYKDITVESEGNGGKVVFAEDVVATIATLAAAEVDGVYGMSGTAFEGLGEKLGKKNYTKGIKVEVGQVECAVDMNIIVRYGFKIQDVCRAVQEAVKNAIETMTGLTVVQVNIAVTSIAFAKETPAELPKPENRVK